MLSHAFVLVSIRFVTFTKEFIKKKKFTNFSILCRSKTELFVTMRDILLAKIESTTTKIMEKMQGMRELIQTQFFVSEEFNKCSKKSLITQS